MKLHKISLLLIGALLFTACDDIDEQEPQGGSLTAEQVQETNTLVPSRTDASFSGMFSFMGTPFTGYPSSTRADDFGFIMAAVSLDLEGADAAGQDNNYNWFSAASQMSSRNANYANPFIRYSVPYREIGKANEIIDAYPEDVSDPESVNKVAQARAIRAFSYMALAPYFQNAPYRPVRGFTHADSACIPVLRSGVDATKNPRASVKDVYEYIIADLNYAIEHLEGYNRGTDKTKIDQNVAYGLRARANLYLENWAEAAADADKAIQGYTPASIAEISTPSFCQLSEHNWIWGIELTQAILNTGNKRYATASSWVSAFSGDGYAPACTLTPCINKLLYDKIPDTDVRKGWWLDENLSSPLLETIVWDGYTGTDIATYEMANGNKVAMLPYTGVKFGMKSGIGSTANDNDWPLMRVEEMILIKAEGLSKSGQASAATQVLNDFVQTYRDPSYNAASTGLVLDDEIWKQRRIELWMEGFFTFDAKRLAKNIVRTHGEGTTNFPDAFQFNVSADDYWLNLRFPQTEKDNNTAIVDNSGSTQPVPGQNENLRDGVTD